MYSGHGVCDELGQPSQQGRHKLLLERPPTPNLTVELRHQGTDIAVIWSRRRRTYATLLLASKWHIVVQEIVLIYPDLEPRKARQSPYS